ncbi:hypothetical protein PPERSA_08310 [Pseudocohnilembus persalinus]|uniref:Histidine phosphatase superfamily, clade-2 n=1 Tax=Pseudocohnilembus persalinus TaxID=266149 RepID=A0A0V0QP30_PSEPJ|nr:hypothetical protein PPERSA_08310 [Pseudocohnilembus persalinus]|eukprot:KRX04095.1 hypothetical protein PPERSA_08310 [Pseudocohnilembus persalinus]
MINKFLNLFLISILLTLTNSKLSFVFSAYRHGARYTQKNYYDGKDQPHGKLSPTGIRQHYELGQIIRKKYIEDLKFLNETYNFDEIYTFSTDVDRTIQSANSQLMGMYPFKTGQDIYHNVDKEYLIPPYEGIQYENLGDEALPDLYVPPIIHNTNTESNIIMYPQCNNIISKLIKFATKPATLLQAKNFISWSKPTLQYTRELFNDTSLQIYDLPYIQDVLVCDMYNGRTLPYGFSPDSVYWKNLTYFVSYISYFAQQDTEVLDIVNSGVMNLLIQNFDSVVKKTNGKYKWTMLSAHDSNLSNYLPAFNLTSSKCLKQIYETGKTKSLNCNDSPPFAANLFIELYENDENTNQNENYNDYYVKIQYDGEYQYMCEKKQTQCNYAEFRERILYHSYTDQERDEICNNNKQNQQTQSQEYQEIAEHLQKGEWKDFFKIFYNNHQQLLDQDIENYEVNPVLNKKINNNNLKRNQEIIYEINDDFQQLFEITI